MTKVQFLFFLLLCLLSCSGSEKQNREKAIQKQKEAENIFFKELTKGSSDLDSLQVAKSLSLLDEAIALDSMYGLAYQTKSQIFEKTDRPFQAVETLDLAIKCNSGDYTLILYRGWLHDRLGNFDLAQLDYENCLHILKKRIEKEPNNFGLLMDRCFILILKGNQDEGMRDLKSLQNRPHSEDKKKQLKYAIEVLSHGRSYFIGDTNKSLQNYLNKFN